MSAGVLWRYKQPDPEMEPQEAFQLCIAALIHLGIDFGEIQAAMDMAILEGMINEDDMDSDDE